MEVALGVSLRDVHPAQAVDKEELLSIAQTISFSQFNSVCFIFTIFF